MYLLHCPRCRGVTLNPDDSAGHACRWCGWRGRPPRDRVVDAPAAVRRFVLADLRPVANQLLTFGIGQFITALIFLWFFIGAMSQGNVYLVGRFEQNPMTYAIGLVLLAGGVLILAAAIAVRLGRNRLVALTGAWLALASPLLLGIPVGLWAVWKLTRPEARAAFTRPV